MFCIYIDEEMVDVHDSACPFVREGAGDDIRGAQGWHGLYASRGAAIDAALSVGRPVAECANCINASEHINWKTRLDA